MFLHGRMCRGTHHRTASRLRRSKQSPDAYYNAKQMKLKTIQTVRPANTYETNGLLNKAEKPMNTTMNGGEHAYPKTTPAPWKKKATIQRPKGNGMVELHLQMNKSQKPGRSEEHGEQARADETEKPDGTGGQGKTAGLGQKGEQKSIHTKPNAPSEKKV